MSFVRPRWLEDIVRPTAGATSKLRGLKGFDPHHIPAFADPLYADDPVYWTCTGSLPAAVALFGIGGVQTPADDSLLCIVDHVYAASDTATTFSLEINEGGAAPLALITDTAVFKRNRREQARSTGAERVGLLRIADNSTAFTATSIGNFRTPASGGVSENVGHRLYGGEQLFVRGRVANILVEWVLQGRLTTKGQR